MMRNLKKLFLTAMLMMFTTFASAKDTVSYDWTRLMNAIIQVESEGNHRAVNTNGNCVGILQITPILVRECNQILQRRKDRKRYTYEDRYNVEKSKEMFILLQEHFNPSHNIEKAIKCWNCGFYDKNWKNRSENYYNKVIRKYNGGN